MKKIILFCLPFILMIFLNQMVKGTDLHFDFVDLKYYLETEVDLPDIQGAFERIDNEFNDMGETLSNMKFDAIEGIHDINNVADFFKELFRVVGDFFVQLGGCIACIFNFLYEIWDWTFAIMKEFWTQLIIIVRIPGKLSNYFFG